LITLLLTGLRREEALQLQWKHIDLNAGTLTAKDPKNHEDHVLPMGRYLLDLFKRRHAATASVCVFPSGGRRGRLTEPRKRILAVAAASGVQFTSHDCRRTFATVLNHLGDSIPYLTLKRLMNHKVADVTGQYVQHDLERLRQAMQQVENFIIANAGVTRALARPWLIGLRTSSALRRPLQGLSLNTIGARARFNYQAGAISGVSPHAS
jgi:integrase